MSMLPGASTMGTEEPRSAREWGKKGLTLFHSSHAGAPGPPPTVIAPGSWVLGVAYSGLQGGREQLTGA